MSVADYNVIKGMPKVLGMHTSFDSFKEGTKVSSGSKVGGACFAAIRDNLRTDESSGKIYDNEMLDTVKYYPWTATFTEFDLPYWTDKWLEVLLEIPFVKRRVIEYTGYDHGKCSPVTDEMNARNYDGRRSLIDKQKYFLIDFTCPVDEPFVVCSLLRIPQEFPDHIVTFKEVYESTGDAMKAFILSVYYGKSKFPLTGGHSACNGLDTEFWWKFYRDQSIAVSKDNNWRSNVLGGSAAMAITKEDMLKSLAIQDVPKHNVLVYGSLRKGMGNHALLQSALDKGHAHCVREEAYCDVNAQMYDTGAGFPAIVPCVKRNGIIVEHYKVNDETMEALDRLEGYPTLYDRAEILLHNTACWIYYQKTVCKSYSRIERNDWVYHVRSSGC